MKINDAAVQQIEWVQDGNVIYFLPVPKDPLKQFRGSSQGLTRSLLSHRKKDGDTK